MNNEKNKSLQPYDVTQGDVLEILKTLPSNSYDGGLNDPPYGIGYMGKDWDQNLPSVEVWQEMLRVCKPGSYLLTFGSPKTFHRLTCHIEDAGWKIMDTLCWLYGEGFPKSQNFSKDLNRFSSHGDLVQRFQGRGTALKTAWEPIVLAMKPTCGSYAKNASFFGCGGLNIDGCRIGENDGGRWPANVMLDEEAALMLDEQSGPSRSGRGCRRSENSIVGNGRTMNKLVSRYSAVGGYNDKGGASRFFYVAKASRSERAGNGHPAVKPMRLCEEISRLILPPKGNRTRRLLVPFSGSGSEMIGALNAGWDQVHGIEKHEENVWHSRERLQNRTTTESDDKVAHPRTVGTKLKINTVTRGDCANMIHRLPDNSVNLALCSPPYPGKREDKYPTVSERDYPEWTTQWMETLKGKLADDGSVLIVIDKSVKKGVMSDFLLHTQLHLRERGWKQHMTQIWFKYDVMPLGHKGWPRHCYEEILWFSRTTHPFCDPSAVGSPSSKLAVRNYDQSKWTNGNKEEKKGVARVCDVWKVPVGGNANGIDHPAKYPQALCKSLIKTLCPNGGTVLDCFAGSGTLLAAKALGRNYFGIDVMKKYVDLAQRRLRETS